MEIIERSDEKLIWSALEYEEKYRSPDWFWALGVIVITSSIAAVIFENYFFAVLLLLSGFLLGFFAVKKPDMVIYEINAKGLKIRNRLYPYKNIKSFWIQINLRGKTDLKPILFIHSERMFMPVKEIYRAWTKVAPGERSLKLRDILTFILQEDDGYRFRVQFMAGYFI